MLIELSVSNFFSFREKQTFSMVAAPRLRKRENVFDPNIKGEKFPKLLKIAAIYGPNASGKSNLIKALGVISKIAARQPSAQASPLPVAPFRFDSTLLTEPSRISVHFLYEGIRYEFELAATPERIVEETLIAYFGGKETCFYSRKHTLNGDQYILGEALAGGETLHEVWKKLTSPHTLFIAQAVANSSEDMAQLRKPFEWLSNGIVLVGDDMGDLAERSQYIAQQVPMFAENMSDFLQEIDVPVTAIHFESNAMVANPVSQGQTDGIDQIRESTAQHKTTLTHKSALGSAKFYFNEESKGTQNLIAFWLPWRFQKTLRTLVADELDSSLHPNIVAELIKKHLEIQLPSQLIFTTHDTHLMDTRLLRRDQFWLTERDRNGATQLRSIHEFDGRESEDLEKRYYEGRYRGLPYLR
ncbi:MAG: AAA family ATPase [Burkholderiales bacterium]